MEEVKQREPFRGRALVVLDTVGQTECRVHQSSRSRINERTAELSTQLARQARAADAEQVAIITPYAAQARAVRERLRGESAIECSTVHRFQGHECDVVIFDAVDTEPLAPGVLLTDTRAGSTATNLLNVSLSRARGKLIIVADVAYFERRAPRSPIALALREATRRGALTTIASA